LWVLGHLQHWHEVDQEGPGGMVLALDVDSELRADATLEDGCVILIEGAEDEEDWEEEEEGEQAFTPF